MLNYVARFVVLYFLAKEAFQKPNSDNLITPAPADSATFPTIAGIHLGIPLALLAAAAVWWILERSKLGFELRAVGANPDASRTAGMSDDQGLHPGDGHAPACSQGSRPR